MPFALLQMAGAQHHRRARRVPVVRKRREQPGISCYPLRIFCRLGDAGAPNVRRNSRAKWA